MTEKPMWTPRPWIACDADAGWWAVFRESDGSEICRLYDESDDAMQSGSDEANAHLIAAAPEMYEALERWLRLATNPQISSETYWREWPSIRNAADAALKKARGETS